MNILLIGLGSIGKKHLVAIRTLNPSAMIYALRSSKNASREAGVKNIYSLDELPIKPDFAIISNPSSKHEATIRSLIPLGVPLFIEKPAITDLATSKGLLHMIQEHEIFSYVACNLRFLDCLRFIKTKLEESAFIILEVNAYCGSYLPAWRPSQDFRESYSALPELGGGVHFDLIHELDYLYWIFGKPQVSQALTRSKSNLDIPAIDYANYQLVYEQFVAQVTLNYFRKSTKRNVEILTDKGTWEVNLLKNQVLFEGEEVFISQQEISATYELQMKYFMDCLEGSSPSFNSFENGIEVLKICLNKEIHESITQ